MLRDSNKKHTRLWHIFADADLKICVFLFVWLVIVVSIGVFFRYVVNRPLLWTGELARYLFIYLSFVAISVAVRKRAHISITFVLSLLPDSLEKLIIIGGYLFTSIFCFVIGIFGISYVMQIYSVPTAALRIPTGFIYLPGVTGMFLSAIYFIALAVKMLIKTSTKTWGNKQSSKEG